MKNKSLDGSRTERLGIRNSCIDVGFKMIRPVIEPFYIFLIRHFIFRLNIEAFDGESVVRVGAPDWLVLIIICVIIMRHHIAEWRFSGCQPQFSKNYY